MTKYATDKEMDEYGFVEEFWALDGKPNSSFQTPEYRVKLFLDQKASKPHHDCQICGKRVTIEDWAKFRIKSTAMGHPTQSANTTRWLQWRKMPLCLPEIGQSPHNTECRKISRGIAQQKEWQERWDISLEEKRQAIRDFRETLGLEKAPTDSTFSTEDLHTVTQHDFMAANLHQMGRTIIPEGELLPVPGDRGRSPQSWCIFLQVIKYLFPEEFAKVEIWNLRRQKIIPFVECAGFTLPNGEPNYELVYPVLERFWELWSEDLGRTPTPKDISQIRYYWFLDRYKPGDNYSDDYKDVFGKAIKLFPKGVGRRGARKLFVTEAVYHHQAPYDGNEIRFMEDLLRFFLPNEDPKVNILEVLMNHPTHYGEEYARYWLDSDIIRRWFKEVVLVGEGFNPNGFPHDTPIEDIERLHDMSLRSLYEYPGCSAASSSTVQLFNLPMEERQQSMAVRHFLTNLWPEFDWNDVAMHRLSLEEKRVVEMLRDVYGKEGVKVEKRLILSNGKSAKYKDTGMPHRMDAWIKKHNQPVDVQGPQHYIDFVFKHEGGLIGRPLGDDEAWDSTGYLFKQSLDYRQDRDRRKARSWNGKTGMGVIYIPIHHKVRPVKGVHGDLPEWHLFATDNTHPGGTNKTDRPNFASLAQLFEMQGAVEIAQDIRNYFNGTRMEAAI